MSDNAGDLDTRSSLRSTSRRARVDDQSGRAEETIMAAKLTIAEKKAICWEVNETVRKDCYRMLAKLEDPAFVAEVGGKEALRLKFKCFATLSRLLN
jgi:hypothetical protein